MASENPKISIITVCYNAEKTIEKTIKSIVSQAYKHIEYIIIDGASTDGTLNIIKRYKDNIDVLVSEKDNGIYDAMNKGINAATGDIIYLLNSDDYFFNDHIVDNIVKEFEENPELELIYGKVKFFNIPKERQFMRNYDDVTFEAKTMLQLIRLIIPNQCIFAKKSLFNKIGLNNTKYKSNADYDWFLRAVKNNTKMKFLNQYIAFYNYQGLSYKTRNVLLAEKIIIVFRNISLPYFIIYFIYASTRKIKSLLIDYLIYPLLKNLEKRVKTL